MAGPRQKLTTFKNEEEAGDIAIANIPSDKDYYLYCDALEWLCNKDTPEARRQELRTQKALDAHFNHKRTPEAEVKLYDYYAKKLAGYDPRLSANPTLPTTDSSKEALLLKTIQSLYPKNK